MLSSPSDLSPTCCVGLGQIIHLEKNLGTQPNEGASRRGTLENFGWGFLRCYKKQQS